MMTRGVIGFCGDANPFREREAAARCVAVGTRETVGGCPNVITSMNPGCICGPWLSASPRIRKYDGGTS
jgi:hypothetical protein